MKVSVIIPNYNNAKFLKNCIESVLGQGFDVVKEIIVIDDHSTDESWEILKQYSKNYPKMIRVYKNEKKGAQSARNFGFAKTTGEFIQWLDSDDILGKNKIKSQLGLLKNAEDNTIAFCGWKKFDKEIQPSNTKRRTTWKNYKNPTDWLIDSWLGGGMMQTACWLVPRSLCNGHSWDENIIKNQDGIYFFQILLRAKRLYFADSVMVYYRSPGYQNISKRKNPEAIKSLFSTLQQYHVILKVRSDHKTRTALATNYANLIAYISPDYPKISRECKAAIKDLGIKKIPKIGGEKFHLIRKFLGFELALLVSRLANKF